MGQAAQWEREGRNQREQLLAWSLEDLSEQWAAGKSPDDRAALHGGFGAPSVGAETTGPFTNVSATAR